MARLNLDFHRADRFRLDALSVGLLLAGALALAWVGEQWSAARATEAAQAGALLKLEQGSLAPKPPVISRADSAAQAAHARIAAQLNAGWQPAFNALAAARSSKIALLSLDAVHAKRQIKLVAEARHLADAVEFIEALQQQPGVVRAVLVQHEIETDAEYQPVRFQALVEWRA
jgi:nitrate reductase NapAB chaperone NapD